MKHIMSVTNVSKVDNNVKDINRMFLFLTVNWYLLISSKNDSIMNSEIKMSNQFLILFVTLEPNTHIHII